MKERMLNLALSLPLMSDLVVKRILRYCIIGGLGTLFYLCVLVTLVESLGFQPIFGSITGFFCLVLVVYLPNYLWVFKSARTHYFSFPRFVTVAGIGLLGNAGIMYAVVNMFGLNYLWGVIGATAVVPPVNFLLNAYWTFRGSSGEGRNEWQV